MENTTSLFNLPPATCKKCRRVDDLAAFERGCPGCGSRTWWLAPKKEKSFIHRKK
jgi:Zn finger protein HypA/HybF involved in hydrogenase expression